MLWLFLIKISVISGHMENKQICINVIRLPTLKLYFLFPFDHKGYGAEEGVLCGVFDGHGKNGHTVSKLVNNRLPSLILSQRKALAQINAVDDNGNFQNHVERIEGEFIIPSKSFHIWKEACVDAFKVMDKEIKLQENLDCSCSGAAAVVVIKQVKI